jgi:hypothetical protein
LDGGNQWYCLKYNNAMVRAFLTMVGQFPTLNLNTNFKATCLKHQDLQILATAHQGMTKSYS